MKKINSGNYRPNENKLLSFGFVKADGRYSYRRNIVEDQLRMTVTVTQDGAVDAEVVDNGSGEEYVLHRVEDAAGAFVGKVKAEYRAVLTELLNGCFDYEAFKTRQAKELADYVRERYGDEPEFLWKKFPDNAVLRRKDNRKWYAAILTVSRKKLGLDSEERVEIVDLRVRPEQLEATVDCKRYFRGYHMNKNRWITVCLDGSVPTSELCERLDESYRLAGKER